MSTLTGNDGCMLTIIMIIIGATKAKMVPFSVDNQQLRIENTETALFTTKYLTEKLTRKALHPHHTLHSSQNVLPAPQQQKAEECLNIAGEQSI